METKEKVFELIRGAIFEENITLKTTLRDDIRMDDTDLELLVDDLEHEFDISIVEESIKEFETVGDIVKCVEGLLK